MKWKLAALVGVGFILGALARGAIVWDDWDIDTSKPDGDSY